MTVRLAGVTVVQCATVSHVTVTLASSDWVGEGSRACNTVTLQKSRVEYSRVQYSTRECSIAE